MDTFIVALIIMLFNYLLGGVVCTIRDTKDQVFYKWYKNAPIPSVICPIVLTLWPVMAYYMLKYRRGNPVIK
jgi:hypothetical protein